MFYFFSLRKKYLSNVDIWLKKYFFGKQFDTCCCQIEDLKSFLFFWNFEVFKTKEKLDVKRFQKQTVLFTLGSGFVFVFQQICSNLKIKFFVFRVLNWNVFRCCNKTIINQNLVWHLIGNSFLSAYFNLLDSF